MTPDSPKVICCLFYVNTHATAYTTANDIMQNSSLVELQSTKKLRNKKDVQETNKSCTTLTKLVNMSKQLDKKEAVAGVSCKYSTEKPGPLYMGD